MRQDRRMDVELTLDAFRAAQECLQERGDYAAMAQAE